MRVILVCLALVFFGLGAIVAGSIRSDIQIGVAATSIASGILMFGQVLILSALGRIEARLKALEERQR